MTHQHLGLHELAERLGVTKQRAAQLSRAPGFPEPCARLRAGPVWHETDIDKWHTAHPKRPTGRPRKATP